MVKSLILLKLILLLILLVLKKKLTGQTDSNGTENVEIMVPIKYLSNFWITLEIPLTNCEITLDLKWC